MKTHQWRYIFFSIISCLISCMTFSFAIQADAGTEISGTVYILGDKDECVPAKNTSIRIEETKGSDVTTDYGGFRISLPDVFKPGDPVTLFIDKPGYQIWDPLEGEIPIPADPLKNPVIIKLDKLGSHRFFSKMQFEWFIKKISDDAKAQVKEKDPNDKIDFTRYLKDWAVKYGFGINEVRAELDKWAAEIEANEMDYHKLGLAAFYRKQFKKAAEEFTRSGEQHTQKLIKVREKKQEIQEQEKDLVEKFIRDYSLAGDSYYYNYHFHDALASYEKALKEADKKTDPFQWASLMNDISNTYWNLGTRSEGEIQHKYFIESVKGYHEILLIYTRDTLPQDWAMTQNNLGSALQEQGIRTGGEAGAQLLAEAVKAYRSALEVRARDTLPQQWAMTQNNLAKTYDVMENWENAAECYINVLKIYPGYEKAYNRASFILHEQLFRFDEAFALDNFWVIESENNDLSSVSNYIEKHFTTGRFNEAGSLLSEVLPNLNPEDRLYPPLKSIEIANLMAQDKTDAVREKLEELRSSILERPEDYAIKWSFNGLKHFIKNSEHLTTQKEWLLSFFSAIEAENREAILKGLKDVHDKLTE